MSVRVEARAGRVTLALRQGLTLNLRLTISAQLVSPAGVPRLLLTPALRSLRSAGFPACSALFVCLVGFFNTGAGDLNSDPHTCRASTQRWPAFFCGEVCCEYWDAFML